MLSVIEIGNNNKYLPVFPNSSFTLATSELCQTDVVFLKVDSSTTTGTSPSTSYSINIKL